MQIKRLCETDNLNKINLLFKELFINEMTYDNSLQECPNITTKFVAIIKMRWLLIYIKQMVLKI